MISKKISSLQNHLVKEYKKLAQSSRYRQKVQKIALEGPNLVMGALKNGFKPQVVFFTSDYYESGGEEWLAKLPADTMQAILPGPVFKNIADTETPQGVAAILPFNIEKNEKLPAEKANLILILDRLQDPGNMGTIIRTAAAAGVDLLYYTSGSVDPYSPKVLRSTAGTIFNVSLKHAGEPVTIINDLHGRGFKLVTACARANVPYWSADLKEPVALVIGNESSGISTEFEAAADIKVSIPLSGSVESLNAAVAAGVIIFEIIRQRSSSLS